MCLHVMIAIAQRPKGLLVEAPGQRTDMTYIRLAATKLQALSAEHLPEGAGS